ncbi:MAG TPA: Maf family protein [Gammaproteobacteria bacterium]|nr:Maf family protein [Gammaproteobacteria bacterium]
MVSDSSTERLAGIYLASASPRRRELLAQIGVPAQRLAVEVDEALAPGETPERYVSRLALDKARAGWRASQRGADAPVLGADTVVVLDGQVLGKPRDRDDGLAMLSDLSGRSHRVLSGVALVQESREVVTVSASTVTFRTLSERERRAYWESGEPSDKAGAYAIQGLGAAFVSYLEGSYSGVMGLPLYETAQLLAEFGYELLPVWRVAD